MNKDYGQERSDLLETLKTDVARMIRLKDLPATCHSLTAISGRDGRTELVLELFAGILNTEKIARVYLYITEDIFDPDGFEFINSDIGLGNKKVDTKTFIKLRALRIVYNVIKNVSTGYANAVAPNKTIYVRTQKSGVCDYRN